MVGWVLEDLAKSGGSTLGDFGKQTLCRLSYTRPLAILYPKAGRKSIRLSRFLGNNHRDRPVYRAPRWADASAPRARGGGAERTEMFWALCPLGLSGEWRYLPCHQSLRERGSMKLP